MGEKIPENTIPIISEDLHYQVARIYGDLGETKSMKQIMQTLLDREGGKPLNRVDYANTFYRELNDGDRAIEILEKMRTDFLQMEAMVKVQGFSRKTMNRGKWNRWEKAYPEIISSLVFIYRETNKLDDAEIEFLIEKEPLGTAGSLCFLKEEESPVLTLNCDVVTETNFREMITTLELIKPF